MFSEQNTRKTTIYNCIYPSNPNITLNLQRDATCYKCHKIEWVALNVTKKLSQCIHQHPKVHGSYNSWSQKEETEEEGSITSMT